jgi:hypothetical protein
MRIIFISGREPTYVRNKVILRGFRDNGFDVIECTDVSSSYPVRYTKVLEQFIRRKRSDFDVIFIGFFGQPLVPTIRKLVLNSKPVIFDAFLYAYDTMFFDMKKFKAESLAGKFLYWLDKKSC